METIGEKIREIRKQKKMSQEELSSLLGISRPTLIKYEKGLAEPSWALIEMVGDILNYNFAEDEFKTEFDEIEWQYDFLKHVFRKMGYSVNDDYERSQIDENTTIYKSKIHVFNKEHSYKIDSKVMYEKMNLLLKHIELDLNAFLEGQEDGTKEKK